MACTSWAVYDVAMPALLFLTTPDVFAPFLGNAGFMWFMENLTLMTRALLVPATTAKLGLCAHLDDCGCTEVQGAVRGQASQWGGALTPRQPSRRVARADGDAHFTDDPPTDLPGNSAVPTLARAAGCAA